MMPVSTQWSSRSSDCPVQNPLISHTLLEVMFCGNAILCPSRDGTANVVAGEVSNSHECPSLSTSKSAASNGVFSVTYHSPPVPQTTPFRFLIPSGTITLSALSGSVASSEMTRIFAFCESWFGIAMNNPSGDNFTISRYRGTWRAGDHRPS